MFGIKFGGERKKEDPIANCKKSIDLYLKLMGHTYGSATQDDAEYLASGKDGLRFGARGYTHTKIRYTQQTNTFYLSANGMPADQFTVWQSEVAEAFKKAGLALQLTKAV